MELQYKEDWPRVRQRYEAWWAGEILDRFRVVLWVCHQSRNEGVSQRV